MKKSVLSCLTVLALVLTLIFSAGAVCSRFAADVILPPDQDVFTSSVYEPDTAQVLDTDSGNIERIDITDELMSVLAEETEAETEEQTVILYGSAEVPADHTLPDVDVAQVEPEKGSIVKPVVICLVIGLVIALIVVLAVRSSYKPVHRKRDAAEYLVDGSLNITASNETFTHSERSERKIQTKDGSE